MLTSSTGYTSRLSEATVDIRKGHVCPNIRLKLRCCKATSTPTRLEIVDSGDLVRFDGGVNMTVMLNGSALPQAKTAGAMTVLRHPL